VLKDYNKVIRSISVAIAGIFGKCGNLNIYLKTNIVKLLYL
jgi:hypothetical protein